MGIGIQGLGSYIESGAGGGGITTIPDGGELAGTYAGSVYCEGNASMADDVNIAGDLFQNYSSGGSITNAGRYDLRVNGSAHIYRYDNSPDDSTQQNGDVLIDGNFSFAYCYAYSSGGTNSQFRIGGDCVGNVGGIGATLVLSGLADTYATDANIYGNLTVGYLEANGGGSVNGTAGRGGYIVVYGDMVVQYQVTLDGGDSSTGFGAGVGGDLYVYGNLTTYDDIRIRGGDGGDSGAGQGGELIVRGNLVAEDVRLNGGYCNSTDETHSAGGGGYFSVQGNVTVRSIRVFGGNRQGTLSAGPGATPASGGLVSIYGSCTAAFIEAFGGSMFTDNFAACDGGVGGNVYIRGNASVLDTDDGDGYVDVRGGGGGSFGGGGFGGSINIDGNIRASDIFTSGGDAGSSGNGGGGGNVQVEGDAFVGYFSMDGGDAYNGNAGDGGSINVSGKLTMNSSISTTGGTCYSTNQTHAAGSGGSVTCAELLATSDIYLNGGDRTGATTTPSAVDPPIGGSLSVSGNAQLYYLEANGGDITTAYSTGNGAAAGDVYIDGNCVVESDIYLEGGNNIGPNGAGRGGDFNIGGFTTIQGGLFQSGGSSNDSSAGGDAGINGWGGSSYFGGGVTCMTTLQSLDGSGAGAAPTNGVSVRLSGSCTFNSINMTDRSQVQIYTHDDTPAIVKIRAMPAKQTLNDTSGTATANINASLDDSIFVSGGANMAWYKITGVAA